MPRVARKPMDLTVENVRKVLADCLWTEEERKERSDEELIKMSVKATGITTNFYFNPKKIEIHKKDIRDMLECLPDDFMQNSKAGGHSFLMACQTKDGVQWGEHINIQELVCLGLASGDVKYLIEDEHMWSLLPGGVPYFYIKEEYKNE